MATKKCSSPIIDGEILRLSVIFIITVALLFIIAKTLALYIENIPVAQYKEYCKMLLPEVVYSLAPERNERILFMICSLILPVSGIIAICFADFFNINPVPVQSTCLSSRIRNIIIWVPLYLMLSAALIACTNCILPDFIFRPLVRGGSWIPWAVCFAVAGILYCLELRKGTNSILPCRLTWGFILILPVFQTFFCRIYTLPELHASDVHHLEIIAYSISQAVAGRFDHDQYGLYSQILAPVFRFTGTSVFNISIIMGMLYILAFWAMMKSCRDFIRGRLWLLTIAIVMFLFSATFSFLNDNRLEPYFAYHPIRFFFPAVGTMLFALQLKHNFKKIFWLIGVGIFTGIGLLWNVDGGIPLFAAFAVWLVAEFCRWRSGKCFWRGILFGLTVLVTVAAGYGILAIIYGDLKLVEMFKSHQIFYLMGYYMIPMPLKLNPWQIVVAVNILGLLTGLRAYWFNRVTRYDQFCMFLAIMGIGLFTYYQGRSHDLTLPAVIWAPLILLCSFCDRILRCYHVGMLSWKPTLLIFPVIVLLTLSVATPIMRYDRIATGMKNTWNGIVNIGNLNPTEERVRFILGCAGSRQEVNIYGENQGIYYAETGLKAGIPNFNRIYLVLIKDKIQIFRELEQSKLPLFVSVRQGNLPDLPPPILKNYRLNAVSPDKTIFFFEPLNVALE